MTREQELEQALREQIEFWQSLPSGVDMDADPDNECPDDATAHIGGLAVKAALKVLGEDHGT